MSTLAFVLAFLVVALLVYMGRYSGRVRASHSRVIAAAPEAVYARVADLAQWQAWNPWLEHAPDARATLVDGTLAWDVAQVGRGQVRPLKARPSRALVQRLDFALPFKFKGRSTWTFEPAAGGTRATWAFKGRVAFTLRAFAATVQGATALDLRFGLDKLAATLEATPPAYTLAYLGVQDSAGLACAQQLHRGPLATLATDLPRQVAEVRQQLAAQGLPAGGAAVALYLKTHLKRRTVDCRIGVELPPGAGSEPLLHRLPAHRAWVLRLDGPPEALELAWYQAMQRLRVEQLQPDPRIPPYERYLSEPQAGRRGIVELHLPLKG
jgi:uncharacterized protein YndB with AHSA1/START domain